jgi:hypothetical protein
MCQKEISPIRIGCEMGLDLGSPIAITWTALKLWTGLT